MDTINHTDYKNKLIKRVLFVVLALLFSKPIYSKVHITVIDTGFCPQRLKPHKNITILDVTDLTKSLKLDCAKENTRDRRFHGQRVLETLIKNVEQEIIIEPLIVFDADKRQKEIYWQNAFSTERLKRTDIFLIAAGLPFLKSISLQKIDLKNIVFVASGVQDQWIREEHKLFPQELVKSNKNILIISDYYPKTKYDTAYVDKKNKYQEHVSYFFPFKGENDLFTGSSYAVAKALNQALKICNFNSQNDFLNCLKDKSKKVEIEGKLSPLTF
ncbi:hypothetical protein [Bacteriovorax sp. Seq25_V]|uniref:hypothetical protein n=1 Tax=Bacteriovorax sp. Seq25_V TaxID=1201288 RepID=UPI00038A1E24|nr:hypothetical protein [Bacteriovorax sp. Seq25_V]EQC48068.1 hypothetical protein M900_1098 [Bacteriovorax sp. Seq25_V]